MISLESETPARLEFFGDTIESIREFDVLSQLSIEQVKKVRILGKSPDEKDDAGLFDYFPDKSIVLWENDSRCRQYLKEWWEEADERFENQAEEEQDIVLSQKKTLIIGNKKDLDNTSQNYQVLHEKYSSQLPFITISAKEGIGLEELKLKIYQMLDIIRVYTKTPGKKPDFTEPIVLKRGSKLEDAASEVHKDFATRLKYARIWGSGKHNGLMVKRDHTLEDGDIIELHL